MPAKSSKVPSYCHHKASGRAVVRLNGRDHYLGPYGSPESQERYARLIAQWQAPGTARQITSERGNYRSTAPLSVNEVLLAYVEFARGYYTKDGEPNQEYESLKYAMRPLKNLFGQTPPDLAALMMLSVLSTLLARKVTVRACPGWSEPMNFWTTILLASGNRKSAVVRDVLAPANSMIRQWVTNDSEEKKRLTRVIVGLKANINKSKSPTKKMQHELTTAQASLEKLSKSPIPRLFADDCTPEKLAELLAENGRIGIISAEGGVFGQMAGMYNRSKHLPLDVYLKSHAGDDMIVDRIERGSLTLESPALTLGLAVQPEVIVGICDKKTFRARGLG